MLAPLKELSLEMSENTFSFENVSGMGGINLGPRLNANKTSLGISSPDKFLTAKSLNLTFKRQTYGLGF